MAPLPTSVQIGIVATVAAIAVVLVTYWLIKRLYGSRADRPDEIPPAHGSRRRKPPGGE